ncbi:uncharacterized protein [Macrobrachium rosenbergii]|uniref:uncharacterized protein n=1 Tax=Macrobrachium rosenbergii TaxID=79674 RepID=UPI0034D53879
MCPECIPDSQSPLYPEAEANSKGQYQAQTYNHYSHVHSGHEIDHKYVPGCTGIVLRTMMTFSMKKCGSLPYMFQKKHQSLDPLHTLTGDKSLLPKNASDYCPSGGIYVQYEQPVYKKYNFSIDGFACSPHQWVKDRHNEGKTCKMVIMYETDYMGGDSDYSNHPGTYYEALRQCMNYNCIGMICRKYNDICWLKLSSQFTSTRRPSDSANLLYWYTLCE